MKPLDRKLLRKLLGLLGSDHDGEVLNAARRVDGLVRQSGSGWETLIPDEPAADATFLPADNKEDRRLLDELLGSEAVADVLKLRLRDMRAELQRGRLSAADRRLLRILHRKAVMDGAVAVS